MDRSAYVRKRLHSGQTAAGNDLRRDGDGSGRRNGRGTGDRSGQVTLELLDPGERKVLRRLTTPARIQEYLDSLAYNLEPDGHTCYSPRIAIREGVAHCMEGAMLGALALRLISYPPLVVDLEAVRDTDHVLAVYREGGFWGAVAKSDYSGLRSR